MPRAYQVILIDSTGEQHQAEVLTQEEYADEGSAGCQVIARNYADDHGLEYRNWRVEACSVELLTEIA